MEPLKKDQPSSDRRQTDRFQTALPLEIRFMHDGSPVPGAAIEIGPNGMRIQTKIPLVEASYVHITFRSASNNTHCEGRVVWTQKADHGEGYESGIDVQKWGGGIPGEEVVKKVPNLKPKTDRRRRQR